MQLATSLVFVAGAVAALAVLSRAVKVNVRVGSGGSFRDLRQLSKSIHECVGEYMSANYSGDPVQLATAVSGLVPRVREVVAGQGAKPLDNQVLRMLLTSSLTAHRCGNHAQAEAAVAAALGPEPIAA